MNRLASKWRNNALALLLVVCAGCGTLEEPRTESDGEPGQQEARLSVYTGSMSTSRDDFTATVLTNGKVLVVGGQGGGASAELYDPATGSFSPTGSMPTYRRNHKAVRLNDGRVLVMGGIESIGTQSQYLNQAVRYDPATGTWSPAGNLLKARASHTATLLQDGRVLVTGGTASNYAFLESCELFDPATGVWTSAAPMSVTRTGHSATRLQNGKVLVVGGSVPASAELYDPATNTWSPASSPAATRRHHEAFLFADGRVFVAGGANAAPVSPLYFTSAELYDPATNTWTTTGSMNMARQQQAGMLLSSGMVLISGGYGSNYTSSVERYNPATGTWTTISPLRVARGSHGVALLSGDRMLVMGGLGGGGSSAELYTDDPICTPTTCAAQGKNCGTLSDGCGGTLNCGTCSSGQACSPLNVCVSTGGVLYDALRKAPRCTVSGPICDSQGLLMGRGPLGPEPNAPNTLAGSPSVDGSTGTFHFDESLDGLKVSSLDGTPLTAGKQARIEATTWTYSTVDKLELYVTGTADSPSWTYLTTLYPTSSNRSLVLSTTFTLPTLGTELYAIRGVFCRNGTTNRCDIGAYSDYDDLAFPVSGAIAPNPPPTVQISEPIADAQLQGTVLIKADATDDQGVAKVEFFVDQTPLGTDTSAPFEYAWGTLSAYNGVHELQAKAYDTTGQVTASSKVQVRVFNDIAVPTASILTPTADQTWGSLGSIQARGSDDTGVTLLEVYVDGTLVHSTTSNFANFFWSTSGVSEGTHTLFARAYDVVGKMGESAPVQVFVDKTPPAVTITSPQANATVGGVVTVTVDATDARGMGPVELLLNSNTVYVPSNNTHPYTFIWDTRTYAAGTYRLQARARDVAGNQALSTPLEVTLLPDTTPPTVSITSPAGGTTVSGMRSVTVDARDDRLVRTVELLVDGSVISSPTASGEPIPWNTGMYTYGLHTLVARARDYAGNVTDSAPVQVTVDNHAPPPPPPPPSATAVYDAARLAPGCMPAGSASCDSASLLVGRATLGPESHAPNTLYSSCQDGTGGSFHADESLDRLKVSTVDGTALAAGKTVRIEATVWAWGSGSSDALDLYYTADASNPSWTYLSTLIPSAGGQQVLSTTYTLPVGAVQAVRGVFRYGGSPGSCVAGSYNDQDDLFFAVK
ncbi:Ig-like domain-containing protein [Archangium lipolyticum]|uniref:Ig-like domain-containing protein n=1 Tax=Archangium lipolyticum TaxID=2970465 RepID=UPI00214A193E|nr:Ig-like domain-containing protein [Archangium lipolyticum]